MRFVRCEACGAKALVAASQCPKCSQPLELRDDSGREVPLGHCKTCDTYYPRTRGGCRFCGTKPAQARVAPVMWGTMALVGVIVVTWGALRLRESVRAMPNEAPRALATVAAAVVVARPDSVRAPAATTASDDTIGRSVLAAPSAPVAAGDSRARRAAGNATLPPRSMDAAAGTQRQQPPLPTVDSLREAADVHWVSATALTWVNVRVDPRRDSEIAGVIPPDTRVELGQSRSGWTHVRASGISGWVGRRMFMPDSAGHPR